MSVTDELLVNNAQYAEGFSGPLPLPPAKHVAVVACMNARLNVYGVLGLKEGDAHVIRNAGGVVTDDEIRSLAISQRPTRLRQDGGPDPRHRRAGVTARLRRQSHAQQHPPSSFTQSVGPRSNGPRNRPGQNRAQFPALSSHRRSARPPRSNASSRELCPSVKCPQCSK